MGMIKCPDCQKDVSDMAQNCPNCGRPLHMSTNTQQNYGYADDIDADKPKKKHKKKKAGCLIAVLAVVVLFIVCVALGSSSSGNAGKNETQKSNVTTTTKAKETDSAIKKGKSGNISDALSLVVNKTAEQNSISAAGGYMSYKPDSGKYAIINVTITNNSKKSQSLLLNYFKLIGPDDATYTATIIPAADEKFITVDTLNPNLSITGNLVFEVPNDLSVSDCKLQYSDFNLFSSISYFKLK